MRDNKQLLSLLIKKVNLKKENLKKASPKAANIHNRW